MTELLTESKNIKNLYDNPDLTFSKIKEIFRAAADGKLEGTEKVDGQKILLSFSVNDGRIKCAKDKMQIISGGLDPIAFAKFLKTEKDTFNENLFFEGLKSFERAIQGLSEDKQIKLFGPDTNIYYSASIIAPKEEIDQSVVSYDTKKIIIHDIGHNEYDRSTGEKTSSPMADRINELRNIILNYQDSLKHENYSIEINAIKKLKGLSDKTPLNLAINKLNSIILSVNNSIKNDNLKLNDNSTIDDYMIARIYILLNSILSRAPSDMGILSPVAKSNLAKKIFRVKGISIADIRNNLSPVQYEYVKNHILNNEKGILQAAISPLEMLITDFSVDMLKHLNSAFIVDNSKEVQRLKQKIKNAIEEIETYGDYKDLIILKRQMHKLKSLDRVTTAAKGFVFDYDGTTYKFMGNFSPINNILNLFKKIKYNIEEPNLKIHLNENLLVEEVIEEIIRKKGNKYCLLSKKTKRNLGCYKSKSGAKKREKQVNYFKHLKTEEAAGGGVAAVGGFGAPLVRPKRKPEKEKE